jgi:pimeloyl-ACP methyl ester carboxylesterase
VSCLPLLLAMSARKESRLLRLLFPSRPATRRDRSVAFKRSMCCSKCCSVTVLLLLVVKIYSASHLSLAPVTPLPEGWTAHRFTSSDDEERSAHVYVPSFTINAIILFLSGFDEPGIAMCSRVNISLWAEKLGFIAVCPNALGERLTLAEHSDVITALQRGHNHSNTTGMYWRSFASGGFGTWWVDKSLDSHDGEEDVRWLADELLPWVVARKPIDALDPLDVADRIKVRTLLYGESLGGNMAFRLACERSESFDGLMIASAAFLDPWEGWARRVGTPQCHISRSLPSWHGVGTRDFWYGNERGRVGPELLKAFGADPVRMRFDTAWRDFASRAMGCRGKPSVTWHSSRDTRKCEEYPTPCPTQLCTYAKEAHDAQKIMFDDREMLGFQAAWDYLRAHQPLQLAIGEDDSVVGIQSVPSPHLVSHIDQARTTSTTRNASAHNGTALLHLTVDGFQHAR